MTSTEHQRKEATSWAAGTLQKKGCVLHPIEKGAWDVETPKGWKTAENWRELCELARSV